MGAITRNILMVKLNKDFVLDSEPGRFEECVSGLFIP